MDPQYEEKEDIIDLYQILGLTQDVCKDSRCDELIHTSYLKKAKVCHPDKNKDNPDIAELFELVQGAYEILSDPKQRVNYNKRLDLSRGSQSSFFRLRKEAANQSNGTPDNAGYLTAPSDGKKMFEDQMNFLDKKRNYARENDDKPISKKDLKKRMNNFQKERDSDLDYKPEKIFESDNDFDGNKFNKLFDMIKKESPNTTDIISVSNVPSIPSAWSGMGTMTPYSDFDPTYGDLNDSPFIESSGQFSSINSYGMVSTQKSHSVPTREMLNNLNTDENNYYNGHNDLEDDYYDKIKRAIQERENFGRELGERKFEDFNTTDTAGYGILDAMGFDFTKQLTLDIDDDSIRERFEAIMNNRNK